MLKVCGNWSGEVESICVNGECYEIELNIDVVYDDDGCIFYFVGVFLDIMLCKNIEKELFKLVNLDLLIELFNCLFF